ncbi:hypothetical protein M233_01385 [Xylella fastidiosa subsp. multiplex Griffin-1]|uniref:Uncharacterized protein n=1 Tax=Xylella fastidiosa subsp. sandyi Ann-1 TaxID=155920 RepID=A0A060HCE0_XYLFS|nr:hypothetical protein D934_03600 [Xylella fastidiosa subsp. sandyi Ann-1]AIC13540.1 hypothetical protein P303_01940 [Xylella fastidiosa MUL0034]ERI60918.1 hypothetical protein M233_01385 [Xylella fastidiosa subsp. multiplex Griffin-1]
MSRAAIAILSYPIADVCAVVVVGEVAGAMSAL